ncbi:TPA: class I SAM-dependent methyltransferase, partial [Streptococcus suis]|nr:class I SAM-dependent methyltransferase [Streptococcus suis]
MVNNDRTETAAYYTDSYLLDCLSGYLPELEGDEVHILEPSVGVGNFLQTIIDRYAPKVNKLIIDVNDIDRDSIALTKALNSHREIPDNVFINYTIANFLEIKPQKRYDLIIGNPPFIKLKASS